MSNKPKMDRPSRYGTRAAPRTSAGSSPSKASSGSGGARPTGDQASTRPAAAAPNPANRRTVMLILGVVAVVILVALVVSLASGSKSNKNQSTAGVPTGSDAQAIIDKVTALPLSLADQIGTGTTLGPPSKVTGAALTANGKPEMLYVGAEYCPYCAAQRWAMVIALSRFGTFSNLSLTHSSSTDILANTPTFTFHGATYSSSYLTFRAVETQGNVQNSSGQYKTLDTPTSDEIATWGKIDSKHSIPFIDYGGRYSSSGASYDANLFHPNNSVLTHSQVVAALSDPASALAKGAIGTADVMTATICALTGNQPANVCSLPSISSIESQLAK